MSNYTRWYREGTVTVANNSKNVLGSGTLWATVGLKPGDVFSIDSIAEFEIDTITDDTHLTLKTPFIGTGGSNLKYRIIRNWTSSSSADIAAQAAELLGDFAKYIDTDMQTLTGKSAYQYAVDNGFVGTAAEWVESLKGDSAYQVAKDNGYSGTQAQWLESLKAAGEWSNANTRLTSIETTIDDYPEIKKAIAAALSSPDEPRAHKTFMWNASNDPRYNENANWGHAFLHESIYRGKNLGTKPTAEQLEAIRTGTFEDLYLGDYWETPMDITYPVLDGADPDNGDTFTNETEARTTKGNIKWIIADFNYPVIVLGPSLSNAGATSEDMKYFYYNGYVYNNLVVIAENMLRTFPMNYKASNDCGYRYSIVETKILPAIFANLKEVWGVDSFHIYEHLHVLLTSRTGADYIRECMLLPSMKQLHGDISPQRIQTHTNPYCYQAEYQPQFELFRRKTNRILYGTRGNANFWTRDIYDGNTRSFARYSGHNTYDANHYTGFNNAAAEEDICPYIVLC